MPALVNEADALGTDIDQEKVLTLAQRLLFSGRSEIGDVTFPFALSDGTLRVPAATHQTAEAKLDGALRLDLRRGELDADIGIALNAGDATMEGAQPNLRLLLQGAALAPARTLDVTELTNFLSLRAFEIERRRVEALQATVLEKQRLRREAALARSRAEARSRLEAERIRLEEEARRKAEAEAATRDVPAPAEAPVPAQQDQPAEVTTDSVPRPPLLRVAPEERVTRQPLPEIQFEALPGVN